IQRGGTLGDHAGRAHRQALHHPWRHPRRTLPHSRRHADRRGSEGRSRALRCHAARHRAGDARRAARGDDSPLGCPPVSDQRLPVVLFWHMHQPPYRDALSGRYVLPWTWLHAIKDYTDMAAHLEQVPGAKAVVNFTPVLVEQIEDLAAAVRAALGNGQPLPDALLATLSDAPLPTGAEARFQLVTACLRGDRENLIDRHAPFAELAGMARTLVRPEHAAYVSDQFLHDLSVWYHLAWMGESVRRSDARVARLTAKGRGFDAGGRRPLLAWVGELPEGVLPRSRALQDGGRCELAVSPYSHPILPLLLDFGAARDSEPDAGRPVAPAYPGG